MKYRKKPIIIEAVEWKGDNYSEILRFVPPSKIFFDKKGLNIITLEGNHFANVGDMIIQGARGDDFYPCRPDIFEMTYEKVEDSPSPKS